MGTLNDYSYQQNPTKAGDSRWVHRSHFDWAKADKRSDDQTVEGRIFQGLTHLIQVRKKTPALAKGKATFFDSGNKHVLSYLRSEQVMVIGNFSEYRQIVQTDGLRAQWTQLVTLARDMVSGRDRTVADKIVLEPYEFLWLVVDG